MMTATLVPIVKVSSTRASLALAMSCAALVVVATLAAATPARAAVDVTVSGNTLRNAAGAPFRVLGVNRGALDSACTFGALSDGPIDDASIAAMRAWKDNIVRVPINEDCWLGVKGLPSPGGGTAGAYRARVVDYVTRLRVAGYVVIVDNQLSGPGTLKSVYNAPMPDGDAIALWASVAAAFKDASGVIFDPYNEPHPDGFGSDIGGVDPWVCWRDGCQVRWTDSPQGPLTYAGIGMQKLVDAIRGAGAHRQPILLGGIGYAGRLTGWLSHKPSDPDDNLIAAVHLYKFAAGSYLGSEDRPRPPDGAETPGQAAQNRVAAWNGDILPVAARVPVITAELGQYDCAADFVTQYMDWADQHGISYLGWVWNATDANGDGTDDGYWFCDGRSDLGRGGPALISRYDGTPTPLGKAFRDRFLALAQARPAAAPMATPLASAPTPTFRTVSRRVGATRLSLTMPSSCVPQSGAIRLRFRTGTARRRDGKPYKGTTYTIKRVEITIDAKTIVVDHKAPFGASPRASALRRGSLHRAGGRVLLKPSKGKGISRTIRGGIVVCP